MAIDVIDKEFHEKVLEQSKKVPVVVDFWSSWCIPCKILSPILEKLAKKYKGKFILAKVNLDDVRTEATNYGITSIPDVRIYKNGKEIDRFIGALPEPEVKEWLDKNLGK